MLALTRKKGESIVIGENTEVVVLNFSNDQVKLGIIAPKSVPVHRKEIFEQIRRENAESVGGVDVAFLKGISLKKH